MAQVPTEYADIQTMIQGILQKRDKALFIKIFHLYEVKLTENIDFLIHDKEKARDLCDEFHIKALEKFTLGTLDTVQWLSDLKQLSDYEIKDALDDDENDNEKKASFFSVLARRAEAQDRTAFTVYYEAYRVVLTSYIRGRVRNDETAKELCCELYEKSLESVLRGVFQPTRGFYNYIIRIANTIIAEYFLENHREILGEDPYNPPEDQAISPEEIEKRLGFESSLRMLKLILDSNVTKPHQFLVFIFSESFAYEPRTIIEKFGDNTLDELAEIMLQKLAVSYEEIYRKGITAVDIKKQCSRLFEILKRPVAEVFNGIDDNSDLAIYQNLPTKSVPLRIFYAGLRPPEECVSDWIYKCKNSLLKEIWWKASVTVAPGLLSEIRIEMLRAITVLDAIKPHMVIAFGFIKLLEERERRFIEILSSEVLGKLGEDFFNRYLLKFSGLITKEQLHDSCSCLFIKLGRNPDEVYPEAEFSSICTKFKSRKVNKIPFNEFYLREPKACIKDWLKEIKLRARNLFVSHTLS